MKPTYTTIKQIDSVETGDEARMDRLKYRLSLQQVADKMGLTKMTLSNLEHGKAKWTEERVEKFNLAIKELKG